jgi:predicted amidohydrolase
MNIGVVQMHLSESIELNTRRILEWVRLAREREVTVLGFPETALSGYLFEGFSSLEHAAVQRALDEVHGALRGSGLHLVLGTPWPENGALYNSAAVLFPDGTRELYHKNHLVDYENRFFIAGSGSLVFRVQGHALGVIICRDQNFPRACSELARSGARGVFICAAHYYPLRESRLKRVKNTALPVARAYENNQFVFKSNAVGTTRGRVSLGGSLIVDPAGIVVQEAGEQEEALLAYDIDFSKPNPSW